MDIGGSVLDQPVLQVVAHLSVQFVAQGFIQGLAGAVGKRLLDNVDQFTGTVRRSCQGSVGGHGQLAAVSFPLA